MTLPMFKPKPIRLGNAAKHELRTQFSALCYRKKAGKTQFLLITSRRSHRWILPRGWPMDNKTPHGAAQQEAWEEAGVQGVIDVRPAGIYSYAKIVGHSTIPCISMVYPLKVRKLATNFPEQGQRRRKWFGRKKASKLVQHVELSRIIRDFDPSHWQ